MEDSETHSPIKVDDLDADSLPQAWRGLILAFLILLLAAWWGFAHNSYAALMIVVSALYCIMYFAVPLTMFRMRRKHFGLDKSAKHGPKSGGLSTLTGWTNNTDAFVQILTIPVALAVAMVALAIVNLVSRQ